MRYLYYSIWLSIDCLGLLCIISIDHMSENKKQSFDEYWAEEEKILKMSYEMSKRWRAERLNKSPAKKLIDRIEGRVKDEGCDDKTRT